MVRKTKPTDEDRSISKKHVQFHCYDIVNKKMKFSTRNEWLRSNIKSSYCIKWVRTTECNSEVFAKQLHERNLYDGYEGSIVRLDTPYQCKRSHSLRKFKDFSDAEANIIGYEEGKGKRIGTLGKFVMQDDDGNKFGCPPGKGHNYSDLANMLDNIHEYIGQRAYLMKEELTGGAHGIETRYPFLDPRVVQEYLWLSRDLKNSEYKKPVADFLRRYNFPNLWGAKRGFAGHKNSVEVAATTTVGSLQSATVWDLHPSLDVAWRKKRRRDQRRRGQLARERAGSIIHAEEAMYQKNGA